MSLRMKDSAERTVQKGQFRELSVSDEEDSHISVILLDSHSGFYFPPATGWSPSLSREGNVWYALHL